MSYTAVGAAGKRKRTGWYGDDLLFGFYRNVFLIIYIIRICMEACFQAEQERNVKQA